jgi:hypothetical protein
LQFFKPENYFEVRKALELADRQDLIGNGCDCLIPAQPPKAALDKRRKRANEALREQTQGDHIRGGPAKPKKNRQGAETQKGQVPHGRSRNFGVGYRPGRTGRDRK